MIKTALLSLACLALTACAATGPNPNTPLRTIGPNVQKAGVFTGKDGAITGTLKPKGLLPGSEEGDTAAKPEAQKPALTQPARSVNEAEYAEFQAWKKAQQESEFDAWKQAREREEFEAWKRSREAQ